MARQKRRRKSLIRAPSKTMERDIIERAERLAKDPGLALPVIVPPATKDPFDGLRRKLERVSHLAGNEKRLKFFANWSDPITKAYAGTLMLAAAGKAPYLAAIKLRQGEVTYAFRGKAKKEKLAGMQWFDHPLYRLLLYLDMSKGRRGLHFYSTPKAIYCSGNKPGAPPEYVAFAMQGVKAPIKEVEERVWTCPHLDAGAVREGRAVEGTYLRIWWRSARVAIGVCDRCARAKGGSTLHSLAEYMAVPRLEEDFEPSVKHRPKGAEACAECDGIEARVAVGDDVSKYVKGEIDDISLIDAHIAAAERFARDGGECHYILDGRCYGTDAKAFVQALSPSEEERLALEAVLPLVDRPLVLEGTTPAKILVEVWEGHGRDALRAVTGDDEELVERFIEDPEATSSPSKVLRRAMVEGRKRNIISKLPKYGRLPAVAAFADTVARAHMTEGAEGALKTLEKERGTDHKVKSVAYALLLVIGKEANHEWQYDRTEKEFATFLRPRVEGLLAARPETYHDSLQALLSATGSTERLPAPGKGGGRRG
jgi:hypothetical protein